MHYFTKHGKWIETADFLREAIRVFNRINLPDMGIDSIQFMEEYSDFTWCNGWKGCKYMEIYYDVGEIVFLREDQLLKLITKSDFMMSKMEELGYKEEKLDE